MAVAPRLIAKRTGLPLPGAVMWCVLALLWGADIVTLTAVKLLLAMAVLVVVPLALDQVRWETLLAESIRDRARRTMPVTGAVAAFALTRGQAWETAVLTVPWMASCVLVSLSGLLELLSARPFRIERLALIAASGYLSFGALWLIGSRAGVQPFDFPHAIIELTAVHFQVAAFAAVVVACRTAAFARGRAPGLLALAGALGVIGSMPVVALGITYSNKIGAVGSSMIGVSLACVAIAHAMLAARGPLAPSTRALLAVTSGSVLAAMALAVQYSIGLALGTPSLRIDQMATTHGILNGAGFVLFGLLAWHLQRGREAAS